MHPFTYNSANMDDNGGGRTGRSSHARGRGLLDPQWQYRIEGIKQLVKLQKVLELEIFARDPDVDHDFGFSYRFASFCSNNQGDKKFCNDRWFW